VNSPKEFRPPPGKEVFFIVFFFTRISFLLVVAPRVVKTYFL